MGKRKKKKLPEEEVFEETTEEEEVDTSTDEDSEKEQRKYKPYFVSDYSRRYPEDSVLVDFVVFIESNEEKKPIGTRDMMSLSTHIKRFNKGIKYLQSMNKYKIGVHFEKPSLANAFLNNVTFLNEYQMKASIPAVGTEITGVITNVPNNLSNSRIFAMLTTYRKIICVKRIMRKRQNDAGRSFLQPTGTVAITFASNVLPDHVDLHGWRFLVNQYIPPVKQCYNCLRYGHLAKYCKNSMKCSICTENHSYKDCNMTPDKAVCIHCKGNHLSISGQCPVKKQKIKENQAKLHKTPFVDLFNKNEFPELNKKNPKDALMSLLKNDDIINIILNTVIKVLTLNKSNEQTTISSQLVKDVLIDTMKPK
ncbi:hypothetical protein RR46_00529 [Papilio xuthus]|uniref:CCHC-type domain-containing protein n=2 Tax=Papilio xuthus TaxID=66420 RepID=A0A0N0PAN6_PAPXU|nr:hypothetical protein RR46_00529 [Papilio xuthus]